MSHEEKSSLGRDVHRKVTYTNQAGVVGRTKCASYTPFGRITDHTHLDELGVPLDRFSGRVRDPYVARCSELQRVYDVDGRAR